MGTSSPQGVPATLMMTEIRKKDMKLGGQEHSVVGLTNVRIKVLSARKKARGSQNMGPVVSAENQQHNNSLGPRKHRRTEGSKS